MKEATTIKIQKELKVKARKQYFLETGIYSLSGLIDRLFELYVEGKINIR